MGTTRERYEEVRSGLRSAVALEAEGEAGVIEGLLVIDRDRLWAVDGYASTLHFAEMEFGIHPKRTRDLLRVGRALADLPLLAEARRSGTLSASHVREITRVATGETEAAWIGFARGRTCREVERAVAARVRGEGPDEAVPFDRPDCALEVLIRFASPEQYAIFLAAVDKVKRETSGEAGLADCVEAMAAEVLATDYTEGPDRPPFQVVIRRDADTGRAEVETSRGPVLAPPETVEAAACDADVVDLTRPGAPRSRTIPPRTRERVLLRAGRRCEVPGCANRIWTHVHHEGGWRKVGHDEAALVVLCGRHHRARHQGAIRIERGPGDGRRFLHADGRPFGLPHVGQAG
jgi:hypothetical protein